MTEPSLRAMATVLAALSPDGLEDDVARIEALKWAHFKDQHIVAYLGLARQLARHIQSTAKAKADARA
jgi:hypothetical protein